MKFLKIGDNDPSVSQVKEILRGQGFWTGSESSVFGPKLKAAVQYFQSTHLGPDGVYLVADGEVGPKTWWALNNPSGKAQESGLIISAGWHKAYENAISDDRKKFIATLSSEHRAGVREIPDGSNQGDGVDKYVVGFDSPPWCALFQSGAYKMTFGEWPKGKREAHVQTWLKKAKDGGYFVSKSSIPVPGNLAVWTFNRGTGHISAVVAKSNRGKTFNSIGGNEGNRVKLGFRGVDEKNFAGYIDLFGDSAEYKFIPDYQVTGEDNGEENNSNNTR